MNQAILQIVCGVLGTFAFALFFHVAPRHLVLATVGAGCPGCSICWCLPRGMACSSAPWRRPSASAFGRKSWPECGKPPRISSSSQASSPALPGGSLYYTMNALINGDMATVIQRGKETGLMALGIVVGILIASEIVRLFFWAEVRRRRLLRRQGPPSAPTEGGGN